MTMTSAAKKALSDTIRALRARLLYDLHAATETTYRLSVRTRDAGLSEAATMRRKRLEGWVEEQLRGDSSRSAERLRAEIEQQAAYTLLNRLVVLHLMEAAKLRAPAVVTGGWESRGYLDFRSLAPALVHGDSTEGYALLLQLVFEDLATELPGIFGPGGLAELVPVPPATLRHIIEALDDPTLASCWTDDMTLGWVYQYWNDPEREALDAKLNGGGKVAPHEIASKTQMFTERYMVDWLLQNSLGPMWLAICEQHGWTAEVQAGGTLDRLEARRVDWRAKREAGEVPLTALMPLHTDQERRWAYCLPQPIPADAVARAPGTVRDLKLLDPTVGSGHFLVVALDLLVALYREEARHRGEAELPRWSDRAIVERVLSHNLHGIDLDPRAVQIAAAALWLKARQIAPDARPERLNLVASNLRLASLADDDPALVELRCEVERETGIPGAFTDTLIQALRGADHLGSLLKIDRAVDDALKAHDRALSRPVGGSQGDLLTGFKRTPIEQDEAKATLIERIEGFLDKHTSGEDLGLRLRGQQLAAGVRFVRLVREGAYDLVVANPPYQGTSKIADSTYIERAYPLGKADLYAAFLLRGLELVRQGGVSAMLTMRNWMFIKQYAGLRAHLLKTYDLRALGDFAVGAFDEVPNDVLSVTVSVFHHDRQRIEPSVSQQPTPPDDTSYDRARTARKRAATLCHVGRHTFDPAALKVVPEWPLVYWWDAELLRTYGSAPLIGDVAPATFGATTGNNARFARFSHEMFPEHHAIGAPNEAWVPFINGAKGRVWMEALRESMAWKQHGLEYRVFCQDSTGANFRSPHLHFHRGVAFSMIGASFSARVHRYPSIFGNMGSSVFPDDLAAAVCAMNSRRARDILQSLNPGVHFEVGDVNRLPLFPIAGADEIFAQVEAAFTVHESHREPSVEYRRPGPSPWRHAQDWAQRAVDRPENTPLPEYTEQLDPEPPSDPLSFALGVALGRFGPAGSSQEGILDPASAELSHALPAGLLFLDTTLDDSDPHDGLGHPAAAPLRAAWGTHGPAIGTKRGLRGWLAHDFFKTVHRGMYDNRPIHWPLSSAKRSFVAWVNIHRMTDQTLHILLADHLLPTLARIDGALTDLRAARDSAEAKAARAAEKQYDRVLKARDELKTFIYEVEACADQGAPPTSASCPPRERDARYAPDLDDGVMINSAALWPLLLPQWKEPKKWWTELSTAKGRKDYDWSHLAMHTWPTRVDAKCQQDPSLGVAHGCFWRYHPARAWAWELRLQDEIGPDFRIEEAPYLHPDGTQAEGDGPLRSAYLRDHAEEALAAVEKEALRRRGRGKAARPVATLRLLEPGLWSRWPGRCWDLETRVIEKQKAPFELQAPDAAEARLAWCEAHTKLVREREVLVRDVAPYLFDSSKEKTS